MYEVLIEKAGAVVPDETPEKAKGDRHVCKKY